MDWIEEIDDILAEIENTVKGDEGDKITEVRGIIQEQWKSGQVDAVVMQHKEIKQLAVDAIDFLRCLEEEGEFRFWDEGYNTQVLRELREDAKKLGVA